MLPRNITKSDQDNPNHQNPSSGPSGRQNQDVKAAHDQAEEDMQQDADISLHSPNDDLDEGESARVGEDRNDLT